MPFGQQSEPRPAARRRSFMDYGGANSLSNFATSLQRALVYLEVTLPETAAALDGVSPCTSPAGSETADLEQAPMSPGESAARAASYGACALAAAAAGGPTNAAAGRPWPDLNSFHFPGPDAHAPGEAPPPPRSRSPKPRRDSSILAAGRGRSTAAQTVFNAVNTLLGIAMLSLPFGLRLSGWVPGVAILAACAYVTAYTAKLLGAVLRKHKHVHSYADIAYLYGGSRALTFATAAFVLDLTGALLSLILIFSDSFAALFPTANTVALKLAVTAATLVLLFLPLSLVSVLSIAGIACTVGILASVVFCGLVAPASPGSLLSPAATSLWPASGTDLLWSLGIFMAPWGGHPVFPELYRDMRHPEKYRRSCTVAFLATVALNLLIAAAGYAMFGAAAEDSITKNIIATAAYPAWVRTAICTALGILPVCKLALVTRPVISVYESQLRLSDRTDPRRRSVSVRQCAARVVFMGFLFALSVAFTSFGRVVAFLGSAICFTICITLPLLFHLRLNSEDLTPLLAMAARAGVAVGIVGAILGTYGSLVSEA